MRLRLLLVLLALLLVTGTLLWWAWIPADAWATAGCQRSHNAAWISVDWTSQPVDGSAVSDLAAQASTNKLAYLFPYVSYVTPDGSFSESYAHAEEFVSAFREQNADTKLLAWIGVPVVNERRVGIRGWVDLSQAEERRPIVDFATKLLQDADFDGVHLNVESVRDGDSGYLLLLNEMRAALEDDSLLSVATTYWLPGFVNALPVVEGYRWSGDYYQQVAGTVDQIVTMTYDSLMPHPALYRLWMREEMRGIRRNLARGEQQDVELLTGISVSREKTLTHHPEVENLQHGLAGFCAGLATSAPGSTAQGVAIYAAWEATDADWALWQRWLGNLSFSSSALD